MFAILSKSRRALILLMLLGWCVPSFALGDDEVPVSGPRGDVSASPPGTATVVGKVIYHRDPTRPWRLGRYYIRRPKTGELAEAVVAISGRTLTAPNAQREPLTHTINQQDFQFTPETIAIRVGDRVKFLNSDNQVHNVQTSHSRQAFNVNMPVGGEHVETFPFAGGIRQPFRIGCVYHSAMRAWIFVFDHPWFQLTGASGEFQLTGVPPGQYRLEVMHPAGELRSSRTITLNADETVVADFQLTAGDHAREQRQP